MDKDKTTKIIDREIIDDVVDDIIKIFSANKNCLTKVECKKILNIIFEALFDEKLEKKNFDYIFKLLSKNSNNCVYKNDLEPVAKALGISFNVNFITNSPLFNDKVCIKLGKFLLPDSYYIKKGD
jgi:hypothetical protein